MNIMNRKCWIIITLLASSLLSASAEDGYRLFTATDGRSMEGQLLEYNPSTQKIRIQRRGGKKLWVSPEIFCQTDLNYIRDWIKASTFMSNSNFRISIKKAKSTRGKTELIRTEKVSFEVTLKNATKDSLADLKIEYCYYITRVGMGELKDQERVEYIPGQAVSIPPSRPLKLQTQSTKLTTTYKKKTEIVRNYSSNGSYTTSTNVSKVKVSDDKLDGIWIRILGPTLDGKRLYRDITYPTKLMENRTWGSKSGR